MGEQGHLEAFEQFLEGYCAFLEQVLQEEEHKLEVLLTHDPQAIGAAVGRQQALNLEMKNREETRMRLQQQAGFGQMALRDIAAALPDGPRQRFARLHGRLQQLAGQIRFLNGKSMQLARASLQAIDQQLPPVQGYTEDGRQVAAQMGEGAPILDSKI